MTLCTAAIVSLLTLGLFLHAHGDDTEPLDLVIKTALGSLKGDYVSVKDKETGAHAFLGVPFAKPPLGPALRLAPPQPVESWEGVRDATQQPLMCIQVKALTEDLYAKVGLKVKVQDISEDCLYLNIYTPATRAPDAKLPVMFWIHGGGFVMGAASSFDGSAMAVYEDVVVVQIQYRLGLLGLLSTGEKDMAGNYGLLDQVEALKWVQKHIHNFGGNPDLVTIYGESAGGMSVSFLLLSPLTNGLFHRAIAQSGTAALFELLQEDPMTNARMAANMSGCNIESAESISDCMRNLDVQKMVELAEVQELRFTITVDGQLLPKPVNDMYRNHEVQKVPFMTGITSDEGGWLLLSFMAPPNWTEGMTREEVMGVLSVFYPLEPKDVALNLIIDEYSGKSEDPKTLRKAAADIVGDLIFTVPGVTTINAHSDVGAPVYVYEYNYTPQSIRNLRPDFVGSDHGDDLFAVFGFCFTTQYVTMLECSKEDEDFNLRIMKIWANFARTGSPNGDGLLHWPQYGPEENYMFIDTEQEVRQGLRKDRLVFLTETLPKTLQELAKKAHVEL